MTVPAADSVRLCYDSFTDLLAELRPEEWDMASLCPGWTVKDVAAHLAGIERALAGWAPSGEDPPPFDTIGAYMQQARGRSGAELLADLNATLERRRAELEAMSDADFDAASWTPVGIQTYGRFMAVRTFDFWVHEQDIRVPLGRPGHLDGPAAEMSLEEVRLSLGYIVGKKARVPDGRSVAIVLTGPLTGRLCAVVDGRARAVDHLDQPDATVTTDFLTFMLLACGRIDPEDPISDGRVTYAGDAALADRLARNLAFTF
jgi:uncharacterized protein (TIGR03083 family)